MQELDTCSFLNNFLGKMCRKFILKNGNKFESSSNVALNFNELGYTSLYRIFAASMKKISKKENLCEVIIENLVEMLFY